MSEDRDPSRYDIFMAASRAQEREHERQKMREAALHAKLIAFTIIFIASSAIAAAWTYGIYHDWLYRPQIIQK